MLAQELGVPCLCLAGSLGDGWEASAGAFTRVLTATPEGISPDEGIANAEMLIEEAAARLPEVRSSR